MFNTSNYSIDTAFNDIQVGFGKNSWYIKKPLTECRNLFEGEEISYQVQAFLCKCGKQYIYITQKNKKRISYKCSACDNRHFFDVNCYSNKYNDLLVNIDQKVILYIENEEYAYAKVYVNTPIHIDLSSNKIIFKKQLVFSLRICLNGGEERHQEQHILSSDVTENTYNQLLAYIDKHYLAHKLKDYDTLEMNKKTPPQYRKIVKFFLQFPYFKDSIFASWKMDEGLYHAGGIEKTPRNFLSYIRNHRREKSIIRSIAMRYSHEIEVSKFNLFLPYIICRTFKDPNHVCTLINNYELILTDHTTDNMIRLAQKHMRLLEFLLQQYSEKAIVNILNKMCSDPMYWEDSVMMFDTHLALELTSKHFNRPKANLKAIHNELIRARHYSEYSLKKVDFTYHNNIKQSCGLWHDKFDILLPENSDELIQWSSPQYLQNCLYGFVNEVHAQKTTIFGIKKENQLMYAIEIRDNRLAQMYGKYNSTIQGTDQSSLVAWYEHYFNENTPCQQNILENHEG